MTIEIQHRVGNGDLCELCRKPLPARVLVQTERSGEETLYHVECCQGRELFTKVDVKRI